jgi:hypothetical protein
MKTTIRLSGMIGLLCISLFAANEIQVAGTLSYANASIGIASQTLSVTKYVNISGVNFSALTFSVPTTAGGTAIPVSNLSGIGWLYVKNNDATNYVDIMTATSGTAFARIQPGEFIMLRLAPGITAPAALAHTAAVSIQYLALEP